ncbi:UNVERIFIED_CONTAM: Retrovirus-related Pol polyprotein from transposon TNT 1-94 [Sesamum radiatum]|uniref:Retrovirus-related Pol polyprotein from transposon TNT 1-94 n=1 Tax=Sesamum radiatum TaxID=300843 RepID=A0AAW2R239_SESRA
MDFMSSNKVWTLVDPPKGCKPIGCKWVYKLKLGAEQEVTTFKARLVARLKQAFQSWNTHFDEVKKSYDFVNNEFDPSIYKKVSGSSVVLLVLYVDDILLIENEAKMLSDTEAWLSMQLSMKDLGVASYILGHYRYRSGKKDVCTPYASVVGGIQYVVQCTRSDIAFALSVTSRYQACAGEAQRTAVKTMRWEAQDLINKIN